MPPETLADGHDPAFSDPNALTWLRQFDARSALDPAALARESGKKLAAGSPIAAFAFADRLCRLIRPSARNLLLRAQTRLATADSDAAIRDLAAATALDPTDLVICRAALAWGDEGLRLDAARRIVSDTAADDASRRRAVDALLAAGAPVTHYLRRGKGAIAGWLAWSSGGVLRIETRRGGGETLSLLVDPDLKHPLATGRVAAAEIWLEARDADECVLDLLIDDAVVETVTPPWTRRPPSTDRALRRAKSAGVAEIAATIIVPVFEDFAATRDCLEALERARPEFAHRVVVVDDASPNHALKAYLDAAEARGAVELLRNETNLGFAASVNAALALRSSGDVLLLNADVLLPPGAIARLRALSRSDEGIGTITPFTNNGELTSYPEPNASNPLPAIDEVARLDALARAANGDALVDLPNGVGFCLYITQACLEAVGALPEVYAQGYYEDVEFCLSARERGYRNVAAPGVYVGHAGSKSFGARKRALVMRNLELIESRFPGYQLESAAFVALDPLRPYRAALDAMSPPSGPVVVVACGRDAAEALGRRRAERVRAEIPEATALRFLTDPSGRRLSLSAIGGGRPQSLQFDLENAEQRGAFSAYVARLDIRHVELLDASGLPEPALAALIARQAETVLCCADPGWFSPQVEAPRGPCGALDSALPCDACRGAAASVQNDAADVAGRRARLARAVERASRIVPLDRLAETFARRVFRTRVTGLEPRSPGRRELAEPRPSVDKIGRVGVLCARPSVGVDRLMLRLARRLATLNATASLVVFGGSVDDEALMATQKAFVTGPATADEYEELARCYRVDALLAPDRNGGFGDLDETALALGLPKAYFDGSLGAFPLEDGDLSLDPRICEEKAASRIVAWMTRKRGGEE